MASPEKDTGPKSPAENGDVEHSSRPPTPSSNKSDNQTSCNPNIPEEENEILDRLRGDAIGTTLYTERFVISTVLKLREMEKSLDCDEQFESDLESLWDMTIEEDVVLKLIELDVFDVFTQSIINYDNDNRLVEILVGIIGNMCTVSKEALEKLCKNETIIETLIQLISYDDSCVLVQLMRLITLVYGNLEAALIWNRKIMADSEFIEHFVFILNNSNNQTLLGHTLETLNAMLARCATMTEPHNDKDAVESNTTILQKIINSNLVAATVEAFETFYKKEIEEHVNYETDEFDTEMRFTESLKKTFLSFLYIHDICLEYRPQAYSDDSKLGVRTCFNIIINTISTENFILPQNLDYVNEMFESLLQIYMASDKLHNEETIDRITNLWQILRTKINASSSDNDQDAVDDFESSDLELKERFHELQVVIEELIKVLLQDYKADMLTNIFSHCTADIVPNIFQLCGLEIKEYKKEDIMEYCKQLEKMMDKQQQKQNGNLN